MKTITVNVNYILSDAFVSKIQSEQTCKIQNVRELLSNMVLEYDVQCPKELESIVSDYAFMTWIGNPVFQKFYHGIPAYEKIKQEYITAQSK